jgi:putative FmdB family regulatory protein
MPLYEYQCEACGARFEVIRKFSDPPLEVCPTCGKGPIQKLVSSPAFHLKGSGWYATDYARKSGGDDKDKKEKKGGTKTASADGEATSSGSSDSSASKDSSAGKESGASKESAPGDKPATTPSSSKDS